MAENSHGYANEAYRACMEGRADVQQQQSAAAQIALLHGIKGQLIDALLTTSNALNSTRLILSDAESREYAGQLVRTAKALAAAAKDAV